MFDKIIDLISKEKNIIIFGDLVLDKYVEITSSRLSSETIIPVMKSEKKYSFLGCAGNVAKIINEFNCNVFLISIIGKNFKTITNICVEENINIDYSIINKDVKQSKKRYIHNNQQYFRIDNCDNIDYKKYKTQIEDNFKNCIQKNNIDMIVIPDYNLGFCNDLSNIIKIAKENNIKIVIDPHGNDILKYKGCNLFKPNKKELQQLTNIIIKNNDDLIKSAEKIINQIDCETIITTLGSDGIFIYEKNGYSNVIPTKKINFIDVCGAGDTINSIISLGLISKLSTQDICKIANIFASIFIKKIGTSKIYFYEILNVIEKPIEIKLNSLTKLTKFLKKYKDFKIGVTPGCFDIFHSGHLELLKFAKKNCDLLIVLLNSDKSIKKLKGNNRPINSLEHRKNLLMQLNFIDLIVVFDEKDVDPILEKIYFNILFKGGDYKIEELKKKFPNINLMISKHEENISTSLIVDKSKDFN